MSRIGDTELNYQKAAKDIYDNYRSYW